MSRGLGDVYKRQVIVDSPGQSFETGYERVAGKTVLKW